MLIELQSIQLNQQQYLERPRYHILVNLVHFDLESIKDLPDMGELKSTGLLDNNLPSEMYPENNINNDIISNEDDINNEDVLKD